MTFCRPTASRSCRDESGGLFAPRAVRLEGIPRCRPLRWDMSAGQGQGHAGARRGMVMAACLGVVMAGTAGCGGARGASGAVVMGGGGKGGASLGPGGAGGAAGGHPGTGGVPATGGTAGTGPGAA